MMRKTRWPLPLIPVAAALSSSLSMAEPVAVHSQALSLNPLGSALSLLADGLVQEINSFWSLGFRYAHVVAPQIAITVIPHFAHAQVFAVKFNTLGVKLGPRYSFSERDLLGAYVLPVAIANKSWVGQERRGLVSQFQIGLGVEGGYAWGWDQWLLELGGGVHYSGYVAHSSFDGQPTPASTWGPLLNASFGYAW